MTTENEQKYQRKFQFQASIGVFAFLFLCFAVFFSAASFAEIPSLSQLQLNPLFVNESLSSMLFINLFLVTMSVFLFHLTSLPALKKTKSYQTPRWILQGVAGCFLFLLFFDIHEWRWLHLGFVCLIQIGFVGFWLLVFLRRKKFLDRFQLLYRLGLIGNIVFLLLYYGAFCFEFFFYLFQITYFVWNIIILTYLPYLFWKRGKPDEYPELSQNVEPPTPKSKRYHPRSRQYTPRGKHYTPRRKHPPRSRPLTTATRPPVEADLPPKSERGIEPVSPVLWLFFGLALFGITVLSLGFWASGLTAQLRLLWLISIPLIALSLGYLVGVRWNLVTITYLLVLGILWSFFSSRQYWLYLLVICALMLVPILPAIAKREFARTYESFGLYDRLAHFLTGSATSAIYAEFFAMGDGMSYLLVFWLAFATAFSYELAEYSVNRWAPQWDLRFSWDNAWFDLKHQVGGIGLTLVVVYLYTLF